METFLIEHSHLLPPDRCSEYMQALQTDGSVYSTHYNVKVFAPHYSILNVSVI